MAHVARVFDQHTKAGVLERLSGDVQDQDNHQLPWGMATDGGMPPMLFQLRFSDGRMVSYAYSDIREIHCRDAGRIEISLYAMSKLVIIIEGRHLSDLAKWLCCAGIRWAQEADPRDVDLPETSPEIAKIAIEEIPE